MKKKKLSPLIDVSLIGNVISFLWDRGPGDTVDQISMYTFLDLFLLSQ